MKKVASLMERIRNCNRTVLICFITGAAFALMGIFQLILILLTPPARTIDHIFLVIADMLISAGCIGYAVYLKRSDRGNDSADAAEAEKPEPVRHSAPSGGRNAVSPRPESDRVPGKENSGDRSRVPRNPEGRSAQPNGKSQTASRGNPAQSRQFNRRHSDSNE